MKKPEKKRRRDSVGNGNNNDDENDNENTFIFEQGEDFHLIHQTNYLLDQQIAALERGFIRDGGYSETLAAARIAERERRRNDPADPAQARAPDCPRCGKPMALRTARKGPNAGKSFWGCPDFPACQGARPLAP